MAAAPPPDDVVPAQELPPRLTDDFFYDISAFADGMQNVKSMEKDAVELFCSFGFESHKRSNIHYVDDNTLLSAVGNVLVFINLKTMEQTYFHAVRAGAIGSIAVHPTRNYIAVAEVYFTSPVIYIFEYPSMRLFRLLRDGTTRGYTEICFNTSGDKLASVGSDPDYMLTLWNWRSEQVILRSKAFSQDVYKVAFAPESDGNLTTSGMGHIKFWRMSATFTGLKLQGYIGKFGASELTDICAFIQLPDGKVLSSTETGNLLLWDGGMIKCELAVKGRKPCHLGRIEVILLIEGEVFTAGEDGYVRVWDFETIDNADVTTPSSGNVEAGAAAAPVSSSGPAQARVFEMEVLEEFLIGKDVKGHLFRLDTKKRSTEKILSFHSGPIAAVDTSPMAHALISLGSDGTIRLYDYRNKAAVTKAKYVNGGSSLVYLPEVKLLDAKGCTVAAGFTDGVLRILSHPPVSDSASIGEFTLHYVYKPHKTPITCISFSQDGSCMATCSEDRTVFFFRVDAVNKPADEEEELPATVFNRNTYTVFPLGFLELESCPTSITFSPDNHMNLDVMEPQRRKDEENGTGDGEDDLEPFIDGKRVLLTTKDGFIYSAIVPSLSKIDTKVTYSLPPHLLQLKRWKLDVPVPKPPPKKEVKGEGGQEENKPPAAEAVDPNIVTKEEENPNSFRAISALRRMRGLVIENDSPATFVLYLDGGYFLVAVVNKFGEGEIRACKFGHPGVSRLVLMHKAPITDMRITASGKYLLCGAADGMICLRKIKLDDMILYKWDHGHETYEHYSLSFEEEKAKGTSLAQEIMQIGEREEDESPTEQEDAGQYWFGHSHDCDRGRICSVVTTFDDSHLCSGGNDGGLFVWRVKSEAIREAEEMEILDGEQYQMDAPVEDITDTAVYSIQEEKVKAEKDREINDAEVKKQLTRDYIAELRADFMKVLSDIEQAAPGNLDMLKSKLGVDPDLHNDIENETKEKITNVRKELQWISEKESIGPNKLKSKYLDDIQTETIEIAAFRGSLSVSTFRTSKLEQTLASVFHPLVNDRAVTRNGHANTQREATTNGVAKSNGLGGMASDRHDVLARKAAKPFDASSKLEARKALRAERSALWKDLMDAKPDESYEDPRDVAAIRYAENHMGDYKLKTGEKYIVPESERVDADKKKRQILMLKESIYSLKEQFNSQVLRLREKKKRLIQIFDDQNSEIGKISEELSSLGEMIKDNLWSPKMERSAFPELRYAVTSEDIQELQNQEAAAALQSKGGNDFMGFGGGGGAQQPAPPAPQAKDKPKSRPGSSAEEESSSSLQLAAKPSEDTSGRSGLEMIEHENRKKILLFKRDRILKAIQENAKGFDGAVESLIDERIALEADVKFADIKLLLLYREWVLLKEFEKYDNTLAEKLVMKKNEKSEIDSKIKECQEKLNVKKGEIEQVIRKEKEILDEFHRSLGENNKHEEHLTKLFKKKIKRSKKKVKGADGVKDEGEEGEENNESEEEEDEDDDDMDGSDGSDSISSSSEADGAEECPPDCDLGIFTKVQELREKKLDQEDVLLEIQKAIEALKKENDGLIKKEKIIDVALKNTEAEIQDFQTQKQQKLNELDVVVPLRLHQIQYLEKNAMPSDMSPSLVFVNDGLFKLRNRIKELQQEKADIRKQHKELKKMHVSLIKSRKEKQLKLSELDGRATDVQMLKFGKIIDLEKLERMGVNRNADELREKLQKEDSKRTKEVSALENKINHLKEGLTDVTKENTILLENLVTLTQSQQALEEALNSSQSSVTAEYSGLQKKDILEGQKLVHLVQQQSAEIDELKREIEVLIKKNAF
ncbi:Cilia- and flagella-associated protein 44 [Irineochytrium annulatum]|nr:Cilia- and flagella-associated protein 44 [Irineochytrium annulatum]